MVSFQVFIPVSSSILLFLLHTHLPPLFFLISQEELSREITSEIAKKAADAHRAAEAAAAAAISASSRVQPPLEAGGASEVGSEAATTGAGAPAAEMESAASPTAGSRRRRAPVDYAALNAQMQAEELAKAAANPPAESEPQATNAKKQRNE